MTQTRTFNYGTPPGPFLLSATNPENGAVAYTDRRPMSIESRSRRALQSLQFGMGRTSDTCSRSGECLVAWASDPVLTLDYSLRTGQGAAYRPRFVTNTVV